MYIFLYKRTTVSKNTGLSKDENHCIKIAHCSMFFDFFLKINSFFKKIKINSSLNDKGSKVA